MRRDLEMQQGFNQKLLGENKDLKGDIESLKRTNASGLQQTVLLQRQVRGLTEDNERLANMYSTLTKSGDTACPLHGDIKPNAQFDQIKKEEVRAQDAKKGWQTVSDEFGGSVQGKSPGSASQTMRKEDVTKKDYDVTLKR